MKPDDLIEKIKDKAKNFAKTHATGNAKTFYVLGKIDAASTILAMIKSDGLEAAILDVAKELIKYNPDNENAKWIIDNDKWKKS